ncbi:MAG: LptF/LptG family permease [Saprospiraceae bacterium]
MEKGKGQNYFNTIMKIKEVFSLNIYDRYIMKQYFTTFLFTLTILSLIAVVFDVSERIEKFISKNVSVWEVIRDYYLNFIPWINSLLFPLYALITVIFFTSRLAERTEIIPFFSSGMSYSRFLKPFVYSALFFTIIHLYADHFLVPRGNKVLSLFENKYLNKGNLITKDRFIHFFVAPGVEAYFNSYNSYDSSGTGFQLKRTEDSRVIEILSAASIRYNVNIKKWTLKDYNIRSWKNKEENFDLYMGQSLDTALNLTISDFVMYKNDKDKMPTPELSEFIGHERKKGSGITRRYEVEKHRRTADPATTFILSFIGVCISSRKVRGGLGLHLAAGIILGVIFIFLSKLSLTFANSELFNPLLAIWMPNIVFSFLAYYLYKSAQK